MPHEEGHTFDFQDQDQYGGHDQILVNTIAGTFQGATIESIVAYLDDNPNITLNNYISVMGNGQDLISLSESGDVQDELYSNRTFGGDGGFGSEGLGYSSFEGKDAEEIFDMLQAQGAIPEGDDFEDWEETILQMPKREGISEEDMAAYTAGVAEDVYGFETDIARAKEDITLAGEGARSDIYGLQTQGAQEKRKRMFGKGLGGGMSSLMQQDASSSMRRAGQNLMSGLASDVRGKRRGIEDATTGLYGVGGTGMDNLGQGGIYGTGGTKDTDFYNLTEEADAKWEGDFETWLSNNLQD